MRQRNTAIVVGGGPAGLLAGAHLAAGGMATTVLVARARLGGRASSQRHDGLFLNQGPHALYLGGAAMRELRALGIDPPGWSRSGGRLTIRDGELRGDAAGSEGLRRWLESLPDRRSGKELATISVTEWLARSLEGVDREIAAALVRLTTLVADHDSLSADVAALQLRNARASGVRYLGGGWQALVDAIAAQARRRGATLRTHAAVRALEEDSGRWTLTLADDQLSADVVIVAVGGHRAAVRLLGDETPAPSGPPVEASTLDVGMRDLPKPAHRFALSLDQPVYVGHYSPPGPRRAQLQTAIRFGRGPLRELEAVFDLVQPGWRAAQVVHRYLPRMIPSSALTTPQTGGLAGRPGIATASGVYLAGDWIGAEGWLCDASLASAAAAARAAIATRARAATPA
jgi:2-polyprenyl-6-methoxyphenol hydroxylase-like FAD-dependent oxidoreductase